MAARLFESSLFDSLSDLVATIICRLLCAFSHSCNCRSRAVGSWRESTRCIDNTSSFRYPRYSSASLAHSLRIFFETFAKPYPGRSAKLNLPFTLKKFILCVRPGVFEVLASDLRCSREFSNDDLPTLDRPRKAISGKPSVVHCDRSKALLTNSAETTFICSTGELFSMIQLRLYRCSSSSNNLFDDRRDLRTSGIRAPYLRRFHCRHFSAGFKRRSQHLIDRIDDLYSQFVKDFHWYVDQIFFIFF